MKYLTAFAIVVAVATSTSAYAEVVYTFAVADAETDGQNVLVVAPVTAASIETTSESLSSIMKDRVTNERPNRTVRSVEGRIFATYTEANEDRDQLIANARAVGIELDFLSGDTNAESASTPATTAACDCPALASTDSTVRGIASGWPFSSTEAKARQLAAAEAHQLPVEMTAAGREFVLIPPGEFVMGSQSDEASRRTDEGAHPVKITEPFYLARDDEPLESTRNEQWGYDDVQMWLAGLQAQAPVGFAFRLPTEAEWEYAARAGKATPYYTGNAVYGALHNGMQAPPLNSETVVTYGCSDNRRSPCPDSIWVKPDTITDDIPAFKVINGQRFAAKVHRYGDIEQYDARQFQPNPWGLFDIYGRFRELTSDTYGPYPNSDNVTINPTRSFGEMKVVRGGSYRSKPQDLRSAARQKVDPEHVNSLGFNDTGLRLVLIKLPD